SGDDLRRQRPRVHLECARPVGDGAWREARVQPSRQAGRQCIRRELQRTAARRVPQRELVPLADRGQNFDPAMGEGLQRRKTALGTWRTYTHRVRTIANSDITSGVEEGGTSSLPDPPFRCPALVAAFGPEPGDCGLSRLR